MLDPSPNQQIRVALLIHLGLSPSRIRDFVMYLKCYGLLLYDAMFHVAVVPIVDLCDIFVHEINA